jgi:hypothetical protein
MLPHVQHTEAQKNRVIDHHQLLVDSRHEVSYTDAHLAK